MFSSFGAGIERKKGREGRKREKGKVGRE